MIGLMKMFNTSKKTDAAEKMDVDDEEKIEIISDFIFYMEFKQNLYRIISNFIFFEEGNLSDVEPHRIGIIQRF